MVIWRRAVGEVKELRALECWSPTKQIHLMPLIFYSWDCSIFQYQMMRKSSVELGLVYKTFVNKHTWETPLLPRKNKLHPLFNAGFFRKLNKVIFPSQPKTHFFRDFLPERALCSAAEWSALKWIFKWIERATLVWNINILQDHKCLTVYQFNTSLLNKSINLF